MEHFDVLIIGAGLSGVGAAWHLQTMCPAKTYAILEGRAAMGGTWDLFRYPGVRSDSDMYTLGYRFRPWRERKAIADGESIRKYIIDTARENGIDRKIRFNERVTQAEWSSADARWTVTTNAGQYTCQFLYSCTGYYDYERGYTPDWPDLQRFKGAVIHPQQWPEGFGGEGKRIVVIGSGATAVTLVPALADKAAHVTMLQRSPTYMAQMPANDAIANWLRKLLPDRASYAVTRWKNVLRAIFYYTLSRRRPGAMKKLLRLGVRRALGREFDVETHFTPRYEPWDERLCIVPDGDLFQAIKGGRASIVTGQIEAFTEKGIRLASGHELPADVIVTATGLRMKLLSGLSLVVDGKPVNLAETVAYKGMMFSGVPNLVAAFGYTNASWTLKCDLTAEHACRMFNHMEKHGYAQVTARAGDQTATEPVINLQSGYVKRALGSLPRQGARAPWRLHQNYLKDLALLRYGRVDDPALEFQSVAPRAVLGRSAR
ncbi:MAG TPA: NAD(P)/FAD-dependent oxidoreductase [Myxococcales bacterium]